MNWKSLSAIVVVAAVGAFVWFVVERSATSEFNDTAALSGDSLDAAASLPAVAGKPSLAVEREADYEEEAAKAPPPPREIDGSDQQVREAAAELSPALAKWLQPQHQIRKWVALVDQMARFRLPSKHLPLAYDKEPFLVIKTAKGMANDPGNFRRWEPLVNSITALSPKKVAIYYKKWSPFLEASYNELGNPQSFDNQLRTTIEHLLIVEPISETAELRRPKVFYEYADPVLENADPLSKWLWRLGPDNMQKLQHWLRDLQSYL